MLARPRPFRAPPHRLPRRLSLYVLVTCLVAVSPGLRSHADEAAGEVAKVTVYQIWARQANEPKVPKELERFREILLKKTEKKKYKEFKLHDKRPKTTFELKPNKARKIELPQKYRTVFTAAMEKKKCVLKVRLEHDGKKTETVIRGGTSLMLLRIKKIDKKGDWHMVLLIDYSTKAK